MADKIAIKIIKEPYSGQYVAESKQKRRYKISADVLPDNVVIEELLGKTVFAEVDERKKKVISVSTEAHKENLKTNKTKKPNLNKLLKEAERSAKQSKKEINYPKKQTSREEIKSLVPGLGEVAKDGARAPYNFVEFPQKRIIESSVDGSFYGIIQCKIRTLTPLFIRDGELPKNNSTFEPTPQFFMGKNGKPQIPATSIKGMFRALCAQITGGDVYRIPQRYLAFRDFTMKKDYSHKFAGSIGQFNIRAGKISVQGEKHYIIPAKFAKVHHNTIAQYFDNELIIENGKSRNEIGDELQKQIINTFSKDVRFDENDVKPYKIVSKDKYGKVKSAIETNIKKLERFNPNGQKTGKLLISGAMSGKKHEFVFYDFDENSKLEIPKVLIDNYNYDVTDFKELFYGKKPKPQIKNNDLIFYLLDEDTKKLIFFGKASLFRLIYSNGVADFVPEFLKIEPTWGNEDFTAALFGYSNTKFTRQGKISISSAKFEKAIRKDGKDLYEPIWLNTEPKYLKILATPKPSAYQFYLKQEKGKRLINYNYNPQKASLSGFKRYWLKDTEPTEIFEDNPKNIKQHSKAIVLSKGNIFNFEIIFSDLTQRELGLLLFLVKLWGDESAHQLGMGKPYGMGAVKIEFESVKVYDLQERYSSLVEALGVNILTDGQIENLINDFKNFISQEYGVDNIDDIPHMQDLKSLTNFSLSKQLKEEKSYMSLDEDKETWKKHRILSKARDFYK